MIPLFILMVLKGKSMRMRKIIVVTVTLSLLLSGTKKLSVR